MSRVHDPVAMPYAEVADRWVVTCPCGLSVEYPTEAEAEQARDAHHEHPDNIQESR